MGIIDRAREAVVDAVTPNFVKKINTALTPNQPGASPPQPPQPNPNAAQAAFEANEKAMNKNNPYYKNVDNSGFSKESIGGK
jgi:hypothetical protein